MEYLNPNLVKNIKQAKKDRALQNKETDEFERVPHWATSLRTPIAHDDLSLDLFRELMQKDMKTALTRIDQNLLADAIRLEKEKFIEFLLSDERTAKIALDMYDRRANSPPILFLSFEAALNRQKTKQTEEQYLYNHGLLGDFYQSLTYSERAERLKPSRKIMIHLLASGASIHERCEISQHPRDQKQQVYNTSTCVSAFRVANKMRIFTASMLFSVCEKWISVLSALLASRRIALLSRDPYLGTTLTWYLFQAEHPIFSETNVRPVAERRQPWMLNEIDLHPIWLLSLKRPVECFSSRINFLLYCQEQLNIRLLE